MNKTNTNLNFLKLLRSRSISFSEPLENAEKEFNTRENIRSTNCGFTDLKTHYHRYGNPNSPEKVIFLHAMGGNLHNWLAVTSYLHEQCDVYVLDLPWHGLTNFEQHPNEPYSAFYCRWLNEFVTQLSLTNFSIVGHSLGARVGTIYAVNGADKVRSLVALTPAYSPSLKGLVFLESSILKMLASKYGKFLDREVLQLFLYEMLVSRHKDTVTYLNYAIREIIRDQSTTEMRGILKALEWFKGEQFDFRNLKKLADNIPVTILCGQKDIYCPNRELLDIDAAKLDIQVIKLSGHLLPLERPLVCANRILETIGRN